MPCFFPSPVLQSCVGFGFHIFVTVPWGVGVVGPTPNRQHGGPGGPATTLRTLRLARTVYLSGMEGSTTVTTDPYEFKYLYEYQF
jgi:hypothetical protein